MHLLARTSKHTHTHTYKYFSFQTRESMCHLFNRQRWGEGGDAYVMSASKMEKFSITKTKTTKSKIETVF